MKSYKVLHVVATNTLSGAEKVVSDICTNLDKRYIPIIICAGDPLKSYFEERGLKVYVADLSKLNPLEIMKVRNVIDKEEIDIVHGHDVKPTIGGYLASRKRKIPVISHIHVTYLWMQKDGFLKKIDEYFRKKYSLSIACSEIVRDYYLEYNKSVDPNKVIYMDNSFNFIEFDKVKITDKDEFKKKLGIDNKTYIYGYLGRLIKIKGADLMIESFNKIKDNVKDSVLLIVGDGDEKENFEKLAKDLGIEDRVIFAGFQKDVYNYMNVFDSFILPSVREGLPIAVLEAMAMKKPVISTPVAGLKKLIKNDYNGIILNERTSEQLSESMIKVYNDKEFSRQLGENEYNFIYENYNIEKYVRKIEDIYGKIIG